MTVGDPLQDPLKHMHKIGCMHDTVRSVLAAKGKKVAEYVFSCKEGCTDFAPVVGILAEVFTAYQDHLLLHSNVGALPSCGHCCPL
jgi:hypothetical protein